MKYKQQMNPISLIIRFRHMPGLDAIRQAVEQQLERLAALVPEGTWCEVVVDNGHPSGKESVYELSVRLHVPGQRLYVSHGSDSGTSPDVLYSVIFDVFDDLGRQMLKNRARRCRRQQVPVAA